MQIKNKVRKVKEKRKTSARRFDDVEYFGGFPSGAWTETIKNGIFDATKITQTYFPSKNNDLYSDTKIYDRGIFPWEKVASKYSSF